MTPHDKEIRLYNDVVLRLNQATEQMYNLLAWEEDTIVTKEMRDSIVLAGVYLKDAQDKFYRYANLCYDDTNLFYKDPPGTFEGIPDDCNA